MSLVSHRPSKRKARDLEFLNPASKALLTFLVSHAHMEGLSYPLD